MMLICPPSPFSPEGEWREFLAEMEALTPTQSKDVALVRLYIKEAKVMLGIEPDDPRFRCPSCKQKTGVNISFGYPSHELFEAAERNEAVLGGCMQEMNDPDRQCLSCGHQWAIVRRSRRAPKAGQRSAHDERLR